MRFARRVNFLNKKTGMGRKCVNNILRLYTADVLNELKIEGRVKIPGLGSLRLAAGGRVHVRLSKAVKDRLRLNPVIVAEPFAAVLSQDESPGLHGEQDGAALLVAL